MDHARLAHILSLFVLATLISVAAAATEPRMVFAHYMLKLAPLYSDDEAGFTKEIQLAQAYGIDGFALNTPFWTATIQARADALYAAAAAVGSFKLFFSADFNNYDGSLSTDNLKTMLTRYASFSSQLTYQGKQFFSTFEGKTLDGSTWRDQVFAPAGDNIFFVPCFLVQNVPAADINNVIQEYNSILDGLLAWDASAWPYVDGALSDASDKAYLQACQDAGKVYMASMSPWFFNPDEGMRGNYAGDELWRQHWESLIALQPPLVEILTWSDWAERTYVVLVNSSINVPSDASANNDVEFPHLAYLDLAGQYYIPWYKTGQQPYIDSASKEAIYIFYYTQSKVAGSSVSGASALEDKVYVTVLLFEAADVIVISGPQNQTFSNLPAGVQSRSMAFSPGQQSAVLVRNGVQVLSVTGALSISSSTTSSDFNVYSHYQRATPT